MSKFSRALVAIAALVLTSLFFLPLWSIDLIAPQYPEGLGLKIHLTTVVGSKPTDLENINGLNHYIGMRPIDPHAIPEMRYFPWAVGALIAVGLVAALVGRRGLVIGWLAGIAAFGAVGVVDFWRWGYNYGHNLDAEHAIIKVPGMSYQPPLIGRKQLLNFTADSWPSIGVWLAITAFALGAVALLVASRRGSSVPGPGQGEPSPAPRRAAVTAREPVSVAGSRP